METVYGVSQNRLAELFQNYGFSTKEYLYFDLLVADVRYKTFDLCLDWGYMYPGHCVKVSVRV